MSLPVLKESSHFIMNDEEGKRQTANKKKMKWKAKDKRWKGTKV